MRILGIVLLLYFGFTAMGNTKSLLLEYSENQWRGLPDPGMMGRLTVNLILTFIGAVLAMNQWGSDANRDETFSRDNPSNEGEPLAEVEIADETTASSDLPENKN